MKIMNNDSQSSYLSIQDIHKTWDNFSLVFSANVQKGSILAVAGHSGSGKSSLLRVLCGLLKADSGRIVLDGQDITSLPPAKRAMGMVFQTHALFPHLSVVDNVAYGLISRGVKRTEARRQAEEYLGRLGLSGFAKRGTTTLSGGEAQRVSLARTLIITPKVVLFDEPLSSLDLPLRRRLSADIRSLQERLKFTAVWVSHDIDEIKAVADSVLVLRQGKIVWSGSTDTFNEELLY